MHSELFTLLLIRPSLHFPLLVQPIYYYSSSSPTTTPTTTTTTAITSPPHDWAHLPRTQTALHRNQIVTISFQMPPLAIFSFVCFPDMEECCKRQRSTGCHSSSSFRYMLSLLVNKQCHQVRKGFIAFLLDDIACQHAMITCRKVFYRFLT